MDRSDFTSSVRNFWRYLRVTRRPNASLQHEHVVREQRVELGVVLGVVHVVLRDEVEQPAQRHDRQHAAVVVAVGQKVGQKERLVEERQEMGREAQQDVVQQLLAQRLAQNQHHQRREVPLLVHGRLVGLGENALPVSGNQKSRTSSEGVSSIGDSMRLSR